MPHYRITQGSFRDSDNSIKSVGDHIELPIEVAELHAYKVELLDQQPGVAPVPDAEVQTPAPAFADTVAPTPGHE